MTSNTHETRRNLFIYTIDIYKKYLKAFDENPELEIAGFLPNEPGHIYYNFFWIRTSYVRKYCIEPKPTNNRFYWEVWSNDMKNRTIRPNTYSPIVADKFCDNINSFHHYMCIGLYSYLLDEK